MFNGIIFNTGKVIEVKKNKRSIQVGIKTKINFKIKDLGSSICCNGVCLTIEKILKNKIFFYISNETLKRTNFKELKLNQIINLEKYFRSFYPRTCRCCCKSKKNIICRQKLDY